MSSQPASKASGAFLPALTGARFFAALAVVFHHYGIGPLRALDPSLATIAAAGPAAVSFFYVLSGAVLTWGCTGRDGQPTGTARNFAVRRAARILPAYFLALLLSVAPFAGHAWKVTPGGGAVVRITLGFVSGLFLVQSFVPQLAVGLNTPGWSVSCEAFFYVWWSRLTVALRRQRAGVPWSRVFAFWLLGMTAPALGLWALKAQLFPVGPFPTLTEDTSGGELMARTLTYFPPLRMFEFATGIALGHALRCTPQRSRPTVYDTARELVLLGALTAVSWVLGAGVARELVGLELADRIAIESPLLAPLFALLVWQLARGRGLLGSLLAAAPLQLLGEASYSLYVLQEPVLVWSTAVLKRVRPALLASESAFFWCYLVLLVLISILVHRHVETPLRTRIQTWLAPRPESSARVGGERKVAVDQIGS